MTTPFNVNTPLNSNSWKLTPSSTPLPKPVVKKPLPTAKPPTATNAITQSNPVTIPTITPTVTSPAPAIASVEGAKADVKTNEQILADQIQANRDTVANSPEGQAKQTWLEKLMSNKSPEAYRADATAALGINPEQYQADKKVKIAEIDSLNKEYSSYKENLEQQISDITGGAASRGITTSLLNNQVAQMERNAAPKLNRLSADINSKAAELKIMQGDFAEAQSLINQAVQDTLATDKYELDMYTTFESMNQDAYEALDAPYKEAYKQKLKQMEEDYDQKKADKEAVGELMIDPAYAGAGISISDSFDTAVGKAQKYLTAHPTLDQQLKEAQINSANRANRGTTDSPGAPGSNTTYANDLDAIVGTVLSTIPSKFGQQTFNAQIAKARDDGDKLNIVAAQVLKGQPAEFKNDFRNQAVGVSQIDKAIAEIDAGLKSGVINASKQYIYNIFGKDYDPALARVNNFITSAIQPYRNSVTGAAWGEQEDAEYAQLFGSTKYSPKELRARLVQTKELLKSKSAEGLNAFVNPLGYYDNQFSTGTLAPTPTASTTPLKVGDGGKIGNITWKIVK